MTENTETLQIDQKFVNHEEKSTRSQQQTTPKIIENWDNLNPDDKLKSLAEINETMTSTDIIPIVLVDNSGSTSSNLNGKPILHQEVHIIKNILKNKGYDKCHVMYWNSSEKHSNEVIEVTNLEKSMHDLKINSTGGTDISIAVHNIPELWYQKRTVIYMVTDGEVNGDKYHFSKQIFSLTKRPIEINIVTVENNGHNYLTDNVHAGATIYSTIQTNKLSKYIKSFECFNRCHFNEPFVNFYNPNVKKGQFSYKEYVINDVDFNQFVEAICGIITLNNGNKDYLEKVMYNLSFTLYYYTKNKTPRIKNEVVRLFVSLFEEVYDDSEYIKDIFESEIKNHEEGTSKTYCQYKENRKKLFEKTSDDLKNNVSDCFAKGNNYMSFIIKTTNKNTQKIIQSNMTNSYVRLSDLYYNNGGIHYGNHNIPMLSVETRNYFGADQSLRQWIRAIYSRLHHMQANDERLLYLFLTDMMSVVLSDLPDIVKNGYKNCARIMLEAKRFNSGDLKQITFLTSGNKPKPMIPGYFSMDEILTQCKKYFSEDIEITNEEFWYGICWAYGLKELIDSQIPTEYKINNLIQQLKNSNKKYLFEEIVVEPEIEFKDYITQEDISKTGGYKFPDTTFGKKLFKNNMLLSIESYNNIMETSDGHTVCPITGKDVSLKDFVFIKPQNTVTKNYDDSNFDMKIFNKEYFQRVNVNTLDKMNLKNLELKSVELFDFANYPYEFYPAVPIISEKLYKEKEQYRTSEDFNNQVKLRFDWLLNLNMTNVVIAGGFTKSIILDEKVNDIDMYIYGYDDDKKCGEILERLVKDISKLIGNKYKDIAYLVAYKKEFNVYELIYFENVKNIKKDKFEIQDLTQMKFIVKIQIIMKKHMEPNHIFNIYDIDPCTTLWDGKKLYMTERSYNAYRYLISIPRIDEHYTDTFDMRLIKYYKSGFRIVLPRLSIAEIKKRVSDENTLVINKCKFYVSSIENNNVYIDKCELLIEKQENQTNESKLQQTGVSVYNSIIGDIGSLDDSRSIVKFMKYVQRQNRLVNRVKQKLENNESIDESKLLNDVDLEMKEELNKLKFRGRKYIKQDALIDENSDVDEDSEDEDSEDDNKSTKSEENENNKLIKIIKKVMVDEGINENHLLEITEDVKNVLHNNSTIEENDKLSTPELEPTLSTPELEPTKTPEEYIRVYYKVSTPEDERKINEFDNGTCELEFIWTYENYHKQKDWYNSNVEEYNKQIEK